MLRRTLIAASVAVSFLGGLGSTCVGDIRVCDIRPEENVCSVDSDCVLAFCATDCQPCPNGFARSQVEATYCLTLQGSTPLTDCLRGRTDRCGNPGPPVCVYDIEPFCNSEGKCDIRPTTP